MFKYIVDYKNFLLIKKNKNLEIKLLKKLNFNLHKKIVQSFSEKYEYAFKSVNLRKYKHFKNINIIGMGGSSLGIKAIYNFFGTSLFFTQNYIEISKNINFSNNFDTLNIAKLIYKNGIYLIEMNFML